MHEKNILKENYFILTGAMGAGKSTVLNLLKQSFQCIDEPAREILKQQRKINGTGVPEKDASLFNSLMLAEMTKQYNSHLDNKEIIIFDRGIPDVAAYSELLNTDPENSLKAANVYRYNKNVFLFNGWENIYCNDDERKIDFHTANNFGLTIKNIYNKLGYITIDIPFVLPGERSEFIIEKIKTLTK